MTDRHSLTLIGIDIERHIAIWIVCREEKRKRPIHSSSRMIWRWRLRYEEWCKIENELMKTVYNRHGAFARHMHSRFVSSKSIIIYFWRVFFPVSLSPSINGRMFCPDDISYKKVSYLSRAPFHANRAKQATDEGNHFGFFFGWSKDCLKTTWNTV